MYSVLKSTTITRKTFFRFFSLYDEDTDLVSKENLEPYMTHTKIKRNEAILNNLYDLPQHFFERNPFSKRFGLSNYQLQLIQGVSKRFLSPYQKNVIQGSKSDLRF